ncbi:MAG TPA: hypothetical protein VFX65_11465 [Candidatus Limnocylindrales bacterium]|nr:hypothetical protein [Candidatus Limnocylindrales bacterium]
MLDRRARARHELPEIDAAALEAARAVEVLLAAATDRRAERWGRYFGPLPERLRDGPVSGLRAAARTARAAYGPKDSVRDALPEEVTEPLLATIDRLLRVIARWEARSAE